jgi:hypothetical protein
MDDIGGVPAIQRLTGRSGKSVMAKIQNIAAMLDEEGIRRENSVAPLTGAPPRGQKGRRTNWSWVKPLTAMSRAELLGHCEMVFSESK